MKSCPIQIVLFLQRMFLFVDQISKFVTPSPEELDEQQKEREASRLKSLAGVDPTKVGGMIHKTNCVICSMK